MRKLFRLIIVCFFIYSCSTTTKVVVTNFSPIYAQNNRLLAPQYLVNHINDSTAKIYYKIDVSNIDNITNYFQIGIKATTFNTLENQDIIDSISVVAGDSIELNQSIVGSFVIETGKDTKGVLTLKSKNLLTGTTNYQLIDIDKSTNNFDQYFLTKINGIPLINKTTNGQEIEIEHNLTNLKEFMVKYYDYDAKLPSPPFSTFLPLPFNEEPADIFFITNDNNTAKLNTEKEGIYYICNPDNPINGYTVYNFGNDFPKIKHVESIVEPMRFITSKKEFNNLTSTADSLQFYFEEFWLSCASDPEKAKFLIKNFYARIENSNHYFSSYVPGWKTDRGMIYLIFGAPSVVKITDNKESWTYGEENNYMSVNFVFQKEKNPFSDNHYVLSRSSIYKSHWYRAVDNWRQGKIPTN